MRNWEVWNMKRILMDIKEACQYVGIILLACGAAVWLIIAKKTKI